MKKFLFNITKKAGEILLAGYNSKIKNISHKGNIDLVTETDIAIENYLKDEIHKYFPEDEIIAEESCLNYLNDYDNKKRIWIIDPLDGTTNFAHKYPFCAVSIALEINNEIKYGIVYNPMHKELFYSEKGKGAYLNSHKIEVSSTENLADSLVGTGFPYDRWINGDLYLKEYGIFMKKTQGVRRDGAASLDLCYVAAGRFDGFFERKLKPWDMAAASLIITEAGGKITQFDGKPWHWKNDTILASNGKIHDLMIELLNS